MMIPVLLAALCTTPPAADTIHARVLATHDYHGTLLPRIYDWSGGRSIGGVMALKTVMDRAEMECACPTFRLDGGDQMQGSLPSNLNYGAAVIGAFNLLGIDAAAVGNHELDWGLDTLRARQGESNYPWLAANIVERATGRHPAWATPYVLLEIGGVRVGVVGYLTASTPNMLVSDAMAAFEFRRGVAGVRQALRVVRATHPDFIVIVAHAGGDCRDGRCRGEMVEVAQGLDSAGVDLIVSGHTHDPAYAVVHGIPILRAGSNGRGVGVVDLYRLPNGHHRFRMRVDTLYADDVQPHPALEAVIAPYLAQADSLAHRQVAVLRDPLDRRGDEYGLGRLIADAIRAAAQSDLAFTNRGGIRRDLAAGPVTYGELFEVLPFGNTVYRLTVSGRELRAILTRAADGNEHVFSGVHIERDPSRPAGNRLVSAVLADGRQIVDADRYTVGVPDFLARGGGGWTMLETLPTENLDMTMLDALVAYLAALPQPVVAPDDRRVISTTAR